MRYTKNECSRVVWTVFHHWQVIVAAAFVLTSCGRPVVGPLSAVATRTARAATAAPLRTTRVATQIGAGGAPAATRVPAAPTSTIAPPTAAAAQPTTAPAPTPAPPTLAPTALPTPAPSPPPTIVIIPRTAAPLTNEQRWRARQADRQVLDPWQIYVAQRPVSLLWFDPLSGQSLEIGKLLGPFPAQARFILRDDNLPALEIPYRINTDFGLTAISEALKRRMQDAGYTESVEAYIVESDAVQPKS